MNKTTDKQSVMMCSNYQHQRLIKQSITNQHETSARRTMHNETSIKVRNKKYQFVCFIVALGILNEILVAPFISSLIAYPFVVFTVIIIISVRSPVSQNNKYKSSHDERQQQYQ